MRGTSSVATRPGRQDLVARPRLVAALERQTGRPLTLVSAPAGYGKSTLVDVWAARAERTGPVVSISLPGPDVQPEELWSALLESLPRQGVDLAGVMASVPGAEVDDSVLSLLAHSLDDRETPVVWVLDFGEWPVHPLLGDWLRRLLEACRGGLRVVLVTRTDPPLPLHRYRLDGAITEVRAQDLAFTVTEAARLMQQSGLELAPYDLATLHARTGGWPAGLKFAAMSLAGRADTAAVIREFRGDRGNISEYLMTEVLAKQPLGIRDFLLQTCVVDQLEPGLVEALTGEFCDARALDFMAHANSFIEPVPGSPGCYRYQPLFRELLRSQLSFEMPSLVPPLHRQAARWFAENQKPLAAIGHAVAARAWDQAAHYVVEGLGVGGLLTRRSQASVAGPLAHFPADVDGVEAALTRAALALAGLDVTRGAMELDTARVLLAQDPTARTPACVLAMVVMDALAASLGGDLDAGLEAALVAERLLAETPDHVAARPELRVVVAGCKGRVLLQRGDLSAAHAAFVDGVEAADGQHLDAVVSELQGMVALVDAIAGHLRRATEIAVRLGLSPGSAEDVPEVSAAALALAWVRADEYDLEAAERLATVAEQGVPSYDTKVLGTLLALVRARLLVAQGDYDLSQATLRAARRVAPPGRAVGWLDRSLVVAEAASLLASGQPARAAALVDEAEGDGALDSMLVLQRALLATGDETDAAPDPESHAVRSAPLEVQVDSWLFQAERSLRVGDAARAQACLDRALRVAAPERLRRPFFDAPDDVRVLLDRSGLAGRSRWLRRRGGSDHAVADLDERGHTRPGDGGGAAPVVNPLTAKEQEVLGCLAQLLTTDEIAAEMFVSVNTVRSHVRSIIRKLDVTRRNEAVRRAWELGLLPPRDAA
ncbi:MAG: LuxR C-terminal-related transcriptional regulator [Oryzihumus sp.]